MLEKGQTEQVEDIQLEAKSIQMNKSELRKEIRNRKRQFSQAQLGELSLSAISQLRNHPKVKAAHTLLLYYSLPDEVNTHEWIDELVAEGKQVLLPVVVDDAHMILREYTGKNDLAEGSFHILEPIGKLYPESRYPEIEVAIIPGMSFDNEGHRLGRGKGYYDRFLEKQSQEKTSKTRYQKEDSKVHYQKEASKAVHKKGLSSPLYKIGVCFGFQKEPSIPFESHDVAMDEVITTKS